MLKCGHIILGLFLIIALFGEVLDKSNRPSPSGGQQNAPQATKANEPQQDSGITRGTQDSPFVVRTIKSKEEAAEYEQDRADKTFDDHVTLFVSALVALVGGLQLATFLVMIQTSRRQLRAYVSVMAVEMTTPTAKDKFIHHLRAVNTGQTPARDLRVDCISKIVNHPIAGDFDFTVPSDDPLISSRFTVGASKEVSFDAPADRLYSAAEWNEAATAKGKTRLYSYGVVHYFDVFGWGRTTEFCLWLEPGMKEGKPHTWVNASQHHNRQT